MKSLRGIAFGVFDLFHVGHLRYLQYAAGLCDHLTVAIRSDELKTPGKVNHVIIDSRQRCELIGALACVDKAFIFNTSLDEADYWKKWLVLHEIKVIVVGGDWQGSDRWNYLHPLLEEKGMKVVFAPRTAGISSSQIRQRILLPT